MTPEQTLDWLAQQHFDQCCEERPIQDWIRKMKSQLPEQPEQEPVVLRFNEWTVSKNDLSDYICVGELTLAGIEDNLEGPEFGEVEIERFDAVIEALQEKLVTGRECKKVPLIAYIGANNTTPPQRTWVDLTDDDRRICMQSPFITDNYKAIEAKLKDKNT